MVNQSVFHHSYDPQLGRKLLTQLSHIIFNAIFCHETPKMSENLKYGSKILKKPEKQQKQPHVILKASDHVWMYLICQTKSPIWTD